MNAEGSPSTNVSAFSEVFDYLVVMNYDLWGSWSSSVGPNGALNDTCAEAPNQQGSAVHAVKRWTSAGFPKEKLLLGLPAYGHSFSVKSEDAWVNGTETLALYAPFNSTIRPVGDSWDDPAGEIDACGVATQQAGVVTFWGLVEQGYLDDSGKALVPYIFDNCSQTVSFLSATDLQVADLPLAAFRLQHYYPSDDQLRQRRLLCRQRTICQRQWTWWYRYMGSWRRPQGYPIGFRSVEAVFNMMSELWV